MNRIPSTALTRVLFFILLIGLPATAAAQEPQTRAAEIARDQAERAQRLTPYKPNLVERRLLAIEEAGGLGAVRGWFVTFGGIKQGSGIALGPAYGKLFDNGAVVVGSAAYSLRNFKLLQVHAAGPPLANGRVRTSGRVRWQDAPQLAVYPLGPDSPEMRGDYAETRTEVSGQDYDAIINLFGLPGKREVGRAASINTIDEVPDSSWSPTSPAAVP